VVVAGVWAVSDVVDAAGVVETVVVLPLGSELGTVEAVVEVVNGVVVPVGVGGAGGAVALVIGVVVPLGAGLGVLPPDVTGSVPPLVGPAPVLPVVTGVAGDVPGATLLGLVVTELGPAEPGPVPPELAEPEGEEAAPLGDPELAVVGLVKLLVTGLALEPAGLAEVAEVAEPAEPAELAEPDAAAEPDGAEASPLGDAALAVVGVRPAAAEPITPPELPVPEAPVAEAPVAEAPVAEAPVAEAPVAEAPVPEPVGLFAKLDVTGLVALDGADAPAPPPATVFGFATPVDIWITGTGPVENLPDPVAVTPLPSTLYVSR
jgi:hypothetical protein